MSGMDVLPARERSSQVFHPDAAVICADELQAPNRTRIDEPEVTVAGIGTAVDVSALRVVTVPADSRAIATG